VRRGAARRGPHCSSLRRSLCSCRGRADSRGRRRPEEIYHIDEVGVDVRLEFVVEKHARSLKRAFESRPAAGFNVDAAAEAVSFVEAFYERHPEGLVDPTRSAKKGAALPVILDSGCGTGRSTRLLALRHPDIPVVGVDRSANRLARNRGARNASSAPGEPRNMLLIRADLSDFWRVLYETARLRVVKHYIFYPNPYPKRKHLLRRWHAHPIFPLLVHLGLQSQVLSGPRHVLDGAPATKTGLGTEIMVRSDWLTYIQEFEFALRVALKHWDTSLLDLGDLDKAGSLECETRVECFQGQHDNLNNISESLYPISDNEFSLSTPITKADSFQEPMTNFEEKFLKVGRKVYQLSALIYRETQGTKI